MGDRTKIEDKIKKIKSELGMWDGYIGFSDELRILRNFVMIIHQWAEVTLQNLIIMDLLDWEPFIKDNLPKTLRFVEKLAPIFNRMEFWNKIRICQDKGLLPKGGNLIECLDKINKYRNTFSHPASYSKNIKEYEERERYLEVLQDLRKTLKGVLKVTDENKLYIRL